MKVRDLDIDEAIIGKPIICRDGHPVRIICYDFKSDDKRDILALVGHDGEESVITTFSNGRREKDRTTCYDIVMNDEHFIAQKSFKPIPPMDKVSQFNISAARKGAKVCTRAGESVRIVDYRANVIKDRHIIALVSNGRTERIQYYFKDGKFFSSNHICCADLITPTAK